MNLEKEEHLLPLLPLRGMVVYPYMTLNFDVGREKSIKALEAAAEFGQSIFLVAQRDIEKEEIGIDDIYQVGTISKVKQVMKMPGGVVRVLIEGQKRAVLRKMIQEQPYFKASVQEMEDEAEDHVIIDEAFVRKLQESFEEYFNYNPRLSSNTFLSIISAAKAAKFADTIAANITFNLETKQRILECFDVYERIEQLIIAIQNEIQILKLEKEIAEKVKKQVDQNQKEYYLREQMKAIQDELGDKDGVGADATEFRKRIEKLKLKKEIKEKLQKEIDRFERTQISSAESSVLRNYLETVLNLPWNKKTRESFDIIKAEALLNRDHYGLEKVKERVLEYLSVRKLTDHTNSPILCFVGPPGVGKTSIAKSIAESMGRNYVRISLGGVHDEADIRGHRKTYIGAMEGRIISAIGQAKSKNPLILLDEIDKMGADYKGDPAAALLEVLDGEQNFSFRDHYVEVPFDLSDVMFVTTANTLDTVSRPLLDRMEVIELTGYTEEEKFHIAVNYLIPKQLDKNGLKNKAITIADDAVYDIINYYTREAGVRNLEREIGTLCRKIAKKILVENKKSVRVTAKSLETYLGKHRYHVEMMNASDEVGVARGLAWTQVGGDTLSIEVNVMAGTGKTELTGKLGDVMKESAMAAISYIRSMADILGIDSSFYKTRDIHIHVPEGAVPKDGPSAGITMAAALVSALTGRAVRKDVAMTGEITLRGRVLPIGGLKEKALAAYRAGIRTIIIPQDNEKDIEDIPEAIRTNIQFVPAVGMDTVLNTALLPSDKKNSSKSDIPMLDRENKRARPLN